MFHSKIGFVEMLRDGALCFRLQSLTATLFIKELENRSNKITHSN